MPATQLARIFSDSKCIDGRVLNRAGVQPFRAVSARLLYRLADAARHRNREQLARTGILVLEDFLPPEEFSDVRDEAATYADLGPPTWVYDWGTTRSDQWKIPPDDRQRFPGLTAWSNHPRVIALASTAEQRALGPNHGLRSLEHLHIGDYSVHDEQCDLHMDTFFNVFKLWLYLDDVTPDEAPFVYVPGSHELDHIRLRGDYLESTHGNRGSRRVDDDEVRRRGLERRVVTCRRNTLVLANTCGYHGRSKGASGAVRRSLHMSFRSNPFSIRSRFRRPA